MLARVAINRLVWPAMRPKIGLAIAVDVGPTHNQLVRLHLVLANPAYHIALAIGPNHARLANCDRHKGDH